MRTWGWQAKRKARSQDGGCNRNSGDFRWPMFPDAVARRPSSLLKSTTIVTMCLCFASSALPAAAGTKEVITCGIKFNLPEHLRITKPKRSVNDAGVRECTVNIVRAKSANTTICRTKLEGGTPPYGVCDWKTDGEPDSRIVVAQTNYLKERKAVGGFVFEDSGWQAFGQDHAETIDFFGLPAVRIELTHKSWWRRTRTMKYQSDFAGTVSNQAILLQLNPSIAVSLEVPPTDSEDSDECTLFCSSLQPAGDQ